MATTTWTQKAGMDSTDEETLISFADEAEASASAAASSATAAAASASASATSATSSASSASDSSDSATSAASSASAAESSATSASASATTATTKAGEASSSATAAASSATSAASSASAASTSESNAATSASNAATSETNASTSASNASTSASSASSSATAAASSAADAAATAASIGTLDSLSDVTITTVSTGEVLKYDGTEWVNTVGDLNTTATVQGSDGTSDWTQATGTDPWIATLTVSGILSTDRPIVDIDLSSVAYADVATVQNAWATVYRVEASADDELKIYATDEPAPNFTILITVAR